MTPGSSAEVVSSCQAMMLLYYNICARPFFRPWLSTVPSVASLGEGGCFAQVPAGK